MNMFRAAVRAVREWKDKGVEADFALIGNKAMSFFKRVGGKVLAHGHRSSATSRSSSSCSARIKVLSDAYRNGQVDRVYLVSQRSS